MKGRRVVITGLGLATCLGLDLEENWRSVLDGRSGIRKFEQQAAMEAPIHAAGMVRDDDWTRIRAAFPDEAAGQEKKTLLALWAGSTACEDAGIDFSSGDCRKYGVVLASEIGEPRIEDVVRWAGRDGRFDLVRFGRELQDVHADSIMRHPSHRPSALLARRMNLGGVNGTITAACASATQAIGMGLRAIQRGEADMMLVGGSSTMVHPLGLVFFVLVNAASTSREDPQTICRPFDRKRTGLVMAEGAAVAVIEEEGHALRRNAKIYGELAGYGASLDAYQLTRPHPDGRGAVQSMQAALRDAGLDSGEVDYINAHGTSTKLNDVVETLAVKKVFGDRSYRIPVSSSKSMIGHTLAASGAPEFVYTVLSVARDEIHPTINLSQPDPKCDLDYVPNRKRVQQVKAALSNSFGFGGQNASVIVKKYRGGAA